ncbi:unnamed protein product [Lactuca virosa]|uniref:PB1-like domain-containing protein n=1 Tax=Lactuca virosa TaxID=75947 RepID=A0AAU9N4F3_9ASTR|nr:unnamed protein product [Lactuca virosa]
MVVSNVDFRSMSFMEFISYVKKLVKDGRINVYYCLPQRSLRDGLRALEDENDYVRFLDAGYENGGMINLYIDHSQETVMEWIEEEIVEDGSIDGNTDDDDDVDSELSDNEFVEHELDDEVIQIQPSDDRFIRRKFFRPPRVVDDKKDVKKDLHNFQQSQTIVQPGSLDSKAGIYALSYDMTGSRLVTCEADKTIKMWKEDENATPETHPVNFKPPKDIRTSACKGKSSG